MLSFNASTHIQELTEQVKLRYKNEAGVDIDHAATEAIFYQLYGIAARLGLKAAKRAVKSLKLNPNYIK